MFADVECFTFAGKKFNFFEKKLMKEGEEGMGNGE
jgi:hypothetical protein